ncbi:peptidyl-tRNA hydrolase, chloroplastic isoform X2 [Glycine max]|uniref:peptidyl-tRNA hydrolase, chloroplastic isoform X2 n=1 Tax=Glycine max TaxID=3847 RepID=UPI001B357687|nr:peptidyl-tRNA hydrolase, chloroplastic-like isoform X2 [Glycine max]
MNISGCWVSSMKLPFLGWRFSRPYLSLFFFFFVSHYDHSKLFFFGFHINVGFEGEEEGSSFTLVNCWPRQSRQKVGFEMVDTIAEAEGISMTTVSFKALFGKGFIGDVPVILAKPQTFMNLSGESVGTIVSYYKIPVKQVLVLLPKGGHGGHNGMKSVINHFKGNTGFPRLRIGIGRPPGKMDPVAFVLHTFTKQKGKS